MWRQRGSTTIMAITAMMVLTVASASYAFMTSRNISIAKGYADGLEAQYTAEAAVKVMFVAGAESVKTSNGWTNGQISSLQEWSTTWNGQPYTMTLPMGTTSVLLSNGGNTVQAVGTANGVNRVAFNSNMNIQASLTIVDTTATFTTASLISQGRVSTPRDGSGNALNNSSLVWQLPANVNDTSSPAISPGNGTTLWSNLYTQVMFNDILGLSTFTATAAPQTLFKINYYIELSQYSGTGSAAGYGIYYLAQKYYNPSTKLWDTGNPDNPRAYVVQFDPGITNWGAAAGSTSPPSGAFLVKKVMPSDSQTAAGPTTGPVPSGGGSSYECWDESSSYPSYTYAFRSNIDLTESYASKSGNNWNWNAIALGTDYSTSKEPTKFAAPTVTNSSDGDPGDGRLAYELGNLAEGNLWKASTHYAQYAKVMASPGTWVSDPSTRLVWVALNEGTSGTAALSTPTAAGQQVSDGTGNTKITWQAQAVPTSVQIAQAVVSNGIQIAKISMYDLQTRLNNVNGTTNNAAALYVMPFKMTNKNKISIELLADNAGNRVQLIRVNDVLVLAFNDTYQDATTNPANANKHNILPKGWELHFNDTYQYANVAASDTTDLKKVVASSRLGSGLRVWNAVAKFYTVDDYGQMIQSSYIANFGVWGR